jgi:hypothetical protein
MMVEEKGRATPRALVERILNGAGKASHELRARAFKNEDASEPPRGLIDKVATCSAQITDSDLADAVRSGFGDDELFELVICAAVGEANRQYEAGLAALAEATAAPGAV